MANFDPPIASIGGVTRPPTTLEKNNGLQCGPADLKLFNFLFQKIQAELKSIQDEGGIVGADGDDTTVLQAIQALIAAATGGGDTSQFVLFTQAQVRLPFFPHVEANNGVITVVSPGTGVARVPNGATLLHRGIRPYVFTQTDFATDPSKIYHLRWNPTDGLSLKDCTGGSSYNPGSLAETDKSFDSKHDDALLARIITTSGNVVNITNLANRASFFTEISSAGAMTTNAQTDDARRTVELPLLMARTPVIAVTPVDIAVGGSGGNYMTGSQNHDHDFKIRRDVLTRYSVTYTLWRDYAQSFEILATVLA